MHKVSRKKFEIDRSDTHFGFILITTCVHVNSFSKKSTMHRIMPQSPKKLYHMGNQSTWNEPVYLIRQ